MPIEVLITGNADEIDGDAMLELAGAAEAVSGDAKSVELASGGSSKKGGDLFL